MSTTDEWVVVEVCANSLAAEIVAGLLRDAVVPVRIETSAVLPGLEPGSQVLVPTALLNRAKCRAGISGRSETGRFR
jgi:hypothetical protein